MAPLLVAAQWFGRYPSNRWKVNAPGWEDPARRGTYIDTLEWGHVQDAQLSSLLHNTSPKSAMDPVDWLG